jgi:hypothetical protein
MFFDNRDDLSELLHDLNVEFKESGEKKFAIRQIASYDELSFDIIKRYIPQFNTWIKSSTNQQAEVLTKRNPCYKMRRSRDMYTNSDYEESNWANEYGVYIVWHGELPESPYH